MRIGHALVVVGFVGSLSAAAAQAFHIEDVLSARDTGVGQLKPATIAFSDKSATTPPGGLDFVPFDQWASKHPTEKKFLALFPSYAEPTISKTEDGATKPVLQKLDMYVAQARFLLDRAPGTIDLTHDVTVEFLSRIDPAIKHKLITAAEVVPFTDEAGAGNQNPDRKWCTGRTTSICIASTYRLEGKIPLGITLVNKLRETKKKIADHIDFQSEFSALDPAEYDQAEVAQLTRLDTPVSGVLEQDIFYVNQIMKFGKLYAVFQADPADAGKTAVTAFMALAVDGSVLDKKKEFERVPVLRNLVPAEVLMGKSSFNSGSSISAGLPQYARNEITTIARILQDGVAAK